MTSPEFAYDRARLLDALTRLGSDDEETVLAAARAAGAVLATARLGWDDLLPPAAAAVEAADTMAAGPLDDPARIAALLALPDLSADARETLEEMSRDMAGGTIPDADRTWLRALYARLVTA